MLVFEFVSTFNKTAFSLAVMQLVCQEPNLFATGTSCNSADVGKLTAAFNLRYSLANYVPAFLVSVHVGRFADKRGRRWLLAIPALGHLLFAVGVVAVQLLGGGLQELLLVGMCHGLSGSTPMFVGGCLSYIFDCGAQENRSRDFVLIDSMLKTGLVTGSAVAGQLIQEACPCMKYAHAGEHCGACLLPYYIASGLALALLGYVVLVLPESLKAAKDEPLMVNTLSEAESPDSCKEESTLVDETGQGEDHPATQQDGVCYSARSLVVQTLFGTASVLTKLAFSGKAVCPIVPVVPPRWLQYTPY